MTDTNRQGNSSSSSEDSRASQEVFTEEKNSDAWRATNSSRNNSSKQRSMPSLTDIFEPPTDNSDRNHQNTLPPKLSRPNTVHHRNVSWADDQDCSLPPLEHASSETKNHHNQAEPSVSSNSSERPPLSTARHESRLTLTDVMNPFETEAEQHILSIIQQQQQHRPQADTANSTIFSNIPDHAVDSFAKNHDDDALDPDEGQAEERDDSRQALINSDDSTVSPNRQAKITTQQQHRPSLSVEQTLFHLTKAMSILHGSHDRENSNSSNSSTTSESPDEEADEACSAEQFAQNAAALMATRDEFSHSKEHVLPSAHENEDPSRPSDHGDIETDSQGGRINNSEDSNKKKTRRYRAKDVRATTRRSTVLVNEKLKSDWELWKNFFRPRRKYLYRYSRVVLCYIILPALMASFIMYYLASNPPTGTDDTSNNAASVSWWLLFLCVRQVLTLSLALLLQAFVIDYLALGTRFLLHVVGHIITLLIVQSKGWPFTLFWWAIFDFSLLYKTRLAAHWAYWQTTIGLFSENNPDGQVVYDERYRRILTIAVSVSLVVAIKRFVIGLYLGRQTFRHYGEQLAELMGKVLLISEVARLARDIEKNTNDKENSFSLPLGTGSFEIKEESLRGLAFSGEEDESKSRRSVFTDRGGTSATSDRVIDTSNRDPLTGSLHHSERMKLFQLLEQWEEPRRRDYRGQTASISAVLNFRKALTFIQKTYPFSIAFGPASTRVDCIDSAQKVYDRLLRRTPEESILPFETLALLAVNDAGEVNQNKAKDLVHIFRPDRQGSLTMLDFVKSIDAVYKEFRLLNASIDNATQIDRAIENVFNFVFYAVVATIILSQVGLNPLTLFLSLSSVILAFAFMIGNAASKYFEGLLFILVRRPYGIGDRIHVSHVETDTSFDGSPGWVVENVTLFETTAIWGPTNERCSLSNGSIANSRIINGARSPNPQFFIKLKIPINTPYDKVLILKSAVEEYMKARPREWLSLNGFRADRIQTNEGWIEYVIVVMHRSSWQEIGMILDSKANLSSYCQEVAKQLGMHYTAPPLPVDLTYRRAEEQINQSTNAEEVDSEQRAREFRHMALNRHNIKLN